MSNPTRSPFTIADLAHVVGGKIVRVHHNACPALATDRDDDCCCGEIEYRIVAAQKGGQQR